MSTQNKQEGIKKVAVANNSISTNQEKREKTIDLAKIMVSQFENTRQTENPKQIPLKQFLDDIKSSEVNKRLFLTASKIEDKSLLSEFKKTQLLAVTLSVLCKNRKAGNLEDSIISKTGILQIDFDNLFPEQMNELKESLRLDENVVFFFKSISGNGIKAGYLIDPDKHLESFEAIEAKFKDLSNIEIDRSVKDLRRLCYTSSDHDLFINEYAKPFRLDEVKKEKASRTARVTKSSGVIINSLETLLVQVKKILMEHGELGKRHLGRRKAGNMLGNFLSAAGISLDEAVKLLLDFIKENGLTDNIELAKSDLYKFIQFGMDYKKSFKNRKSEVERPFWVYSENDNGTKLVKIIINSLLSFLNESGIVSVNLGTESQTNYRLVLIKDNIIENVDEDFIARLLRNFIESISLDKNEKGLLMDQMFSTIPYLTDPKRLNFGVLSQEIEFHKDTKDKSYFYYSNTVVEVSKDGIREIDYSSLEGVVWKSQIIKREFKLLDNSGGNRSMFSKFVEKTCTDPQNNILDKDRHISLCSSIGFMTNRHKSPRTNKSIILSEDNIGCEANGRTGKSLIMKGISYIRNILKLDGRRIKINSEFVFQNLDYDIDIIYFDDIERFFKFETFYPTVSEGIRFRRIYEAEQWLPFEESPKFVLSTNYGLQGNSESDRARKFDMELLSYYNSERTPAKEFDSHFFDEWNSEEWNRFDNDMLSYSKLYFENDGQLKEYKSDTLELRKLISAIGKDFYEFAESLPRNEFLTNSEIYNLYVTFLGLDESDITKKGISFKIKKYCQSLGINYDSTQRRGADNKNSRGYIIYSKSPDIESGDLLGEVA